MKIFTAVSNVRRTRKGLFVPMILGIIMASVAGLHQIGLTLASAEQSVSVTEINDVQAPFNFVCPANPLFSPVTISGSGSGSAPPGNIQQYGVQVDWGDGQIESSVPATFTPSSGKGAFTFTFAAGPHAYATNGNKIIKVRLYHSTPPGRDGRAEAEVSITVCVRVLPPNTGLVRVIKNVVNDNAGTLSASDFTMNVSGASASPSFFPGSADGVEVTVVADQSYEVTEVPSLNYTASFSGDCSGSVSANQIKICTITNDDVEVPTGGDTFCGDGIVQTPNDDGIAEQCDDGNDVDNDACTNSCVLAVCGDGVIQEPNSDGVSEFCDAGEGNNGTPNQCNSTCTGITTPVCGNGVMETGEQCDGEIGDFGPYQACHPVSCQLLDLTYCGDGIIQSPNDIGAGGPEDDGYEQCDGTAGIDETHGCTAQCVLTESESFPICGNGIVEFGEQCDGDIGDFGAHQNCHPESCQIQNLTYCGDGIIQNPNDEGVAEQCDGVEGATATHGCSEECVLVQSQSFPICGNGFIEAGEQCDGQNLGEESCSTLIDQSSGTLTCTSECRYNTSQCIVDRGTPSGPVCGNGIVESGEQCDDGNLTGGDGCSESCTTETRPPATTTSPSASGGGAVGGGGPQGLRIFNEKTESVTPPTALVSWFTNIPATTRVVYDTVSRDGSTGAPNYGYAFSTATDQAKITFHQVVLQNIRAGTTYYWRPISAASPELFGVESQFTVAGEAPTVLGIVAPADSAVPQQEENVRVLGFTQLPDTGGTLVDYYAIVTIMSAVMLVHLSIRRYQGAKLRRKNQSG